MITTTKNVIIIHHNSFKVENYKRKDNERKKRTERERKRNLEDVGHR
jgi:hypothetical protein